MKQYQYKGRTYSIVRCTKEDIPSHIERVSSYWIKESVDMTIQLMLLHECIKEGLCLQLVNDKGSTQAVIYSNYCGYDNVTSHLLWIRSKRMFAILGWYLRQHSKIRNIFFMPHTKDYIPFEFVVKPMSIRKFYTHNTPLVIDLYSTYNHNVGLDLLEKGIVEEEY